MAFASSSDRRSLREIQACDFSVQLITRRGVEIELAADNIDHALDLQHAWITRHDAKVAEIFRILPDGTLNPTIGSVGDDAAKTANWGE